MKNFARATLLVLPLTTFACSSMSKKECETANWAALGRKDAEAGETSSNFKRREEQCMDHGLLSDRDKYSAGYNEGLKVFCTYEGGQKFGYSERPYGYQCPKELETDFMRGYKLGKTEAERDRAEEQRERERREEEERRQQLQREQEEELRRQQDEFQRQQQELQNQHG